jgi:uncharacterized repeat protein (TIGR01451 family)
MKRFYLVLIISFFYFSGAKAQQPYTFTNGDISLTISALVVHDSTTCSTQIDFLFEITLQNANTHNPGISVAALGSYPLQPTYFSNPNYAQSTWTIPTYTFASFQYGDESLQFGNLIVIGLGDLMVANGTDTLLVGDSYPSGSYNVSQIIADHCDYGYVSGKIYKDTDNNCIFDSVDTPLNGVGVSVHEDLSSPNMSVASRSGYSNATGNYSIKMVKSWLTNGIVYLPSNYQFIFPPSVCSSITYNYTTLSQTNLDFALQCSGNVDLRCVGDFHIVRPAIPFIMYPAVNNIGCDPISGQLKLILDHRVTYSAALSTHPANLVNGDTLFWNYTNLSSLSNGAYWNSFLGGIHLTPDSTVNIGDNLCFGLSTFVPINDINTSNNQIIFCLPVVNSFDPNEKIVTPKGVGPTGIIPIGSNSLEYTINFQNTGTASALNISVVDTLDASIIPESLEIIGSSHAMSPTWLAPNIIKFKYNNINLPDSSTNEPYSHGYVRFRVAIDSLLPQGTVINNFASIYFDLNAPIITNTANNTIDLLTSTISSKSTNGLISVYPNPFTESTTFKLLSPNGFDTYKFELRDVLGKTIKVISNINTNQFSMMRDGIENGIYIYSISNSKCILGTGKLIIK